MGERPVFVATSDERGATCRTGESGAGRVCVDVDSGRAGAVRSLLPSSVARSAGVGGVGRGGKQAGVAPYIHSAVLVVWLIQKIGRFTFRA
jgi:hypothetical protein